MHYRDIVHEGYVHVINTMLPMCTNLVVHKNPVMHKNWFNPFPGELIFELSMNYDQANY